jgi:Protein of unknown function (DUF2934)
MARQSTEALPITTPDFGALIAERAYFKAEKRGFVPGYELEDWLAAEREVAEIAAASPKAIGPKKPAVKRKGATIKKLR